MKASLQKHMMSHRLAHQLFACATKFARVKRLGPETGTARRMREVGSFALPSDDLPNPEARRIGLDGDSSWVIGERMAGTAGPMPFKVALPEQAPTG